jgi:hypothetical protein
VGSEAEVTAADREKAAVLFRTARADHNHLRGEEAIAQALADERAKAREPFLTLAADFNANGNGAELGDPSAHAWHKAARLVYAASQVGRT